MASSYPAPPGAGRCGGEVSWRRTLGTDDGSSGLAFCAFPAWFVSEDFERRARAEHYVPVPGWLRAAYPAWFAHPRLRERLALLGTSRHLGCMVDAPPRGPCDPADPRDRRNHIRGLLPA